MQLNSYICNVRISTSYHNKAICRRSQYLRPRFGEGILFLQLRTYWGSMAACWAHWSHLALFVWDWNCRARRIASDFTRFYRIAKGVTRNNSAGFSPLNPHTLNIRRKFEARNNKSPLDNRHQTESREYLYSMPRCEGGRLQVKGGFRGNVNTDSRKKESQSSPLFP